MIGVTARTEDWAHEAVPFEHGCFGKGAADDYDIGLTRAAVFASVYLSPLARIADLRRLPQPNACRIQLDGFAALQGRAPTLWLAPSRWPTPGSWLSPTPSLSRRFHGLRRPCSLHWLQSLRRLCGLRRLKHLRRWHRLQRLLAAVPPRWCAPSPQVRQACGRHGGAPMLWLPCCFACAGPMAHGLDLIRRSFRLPPLHDTHRCQRPCRPHGR